MAPASSPSLPNSIEIYRGCDFTQPATVIEAKFPRKGKGKKDPPIIVNGRFDGLELCPLNPAVRPDQSPHYLFAWQNASKMALDDSNGTVYVYDLRADSFERSKFMIQCH